jgi:DNA-directed RNA polymerase specialized sigma24 family protein
MHISSIIITLLVLSNLTLIGMYVLRTRHQAAQLTNLKRQLNSAKEQQAVNNLSFLKDELDIKDSALEESAKLMGLKDVVIHELNLKLASQDLEKNAQHQEDLENARILTAEDWRKFRILFEQRFPLFIVKVTELYPTLSVAERRLLVLIKIGFDTPEIANILGISTTSVYTSRYRLRKKLDLADGEDLEGLVHRVK